MTMVFCAHCGIRSTGEHRCIFSKKDMRDEIQKLRATLQQYAEGVWDYGYAADRVLKGYDVKTNQRIDYNGSSREL